MTDSRVGLGGRGIGIALIALLAACSGQNTAMDAGPDGAIAPFDAGTDAGGDGGVPGDDGGGDAGPDSMDSGTSDDAGMETVDGAVGTDAGPEVDAGTDASTGTDAGTDAGFDAGMDAGFDAGFDAGMDAGFDAGRDAGFDAGRDAGSDAGTDAGSDAGFDAGLMDHSGTYAITVGPEVDPCEHVTFTGEPPSSLVITRTGPGMYRITGASPWVTLNGTIDEVTGAASLSGRGTVAGFTNVLCTFTGTITGGTISGTVRWGAGNELPSGSCDPPTLTDTSIRFPITGSR